MQAETKDNSPKNNAAKEADINTKAFQPKQDQIAGKPNTETHEPPHHGIKTRKKTKSTTYVGGCVDFYCPPVEKPEKEKEDKTDKFSHIGGCMW